MMSPTQIRILELKKEVVDTRLKQIKESKEFNETGDFMMRITGSTDEDLRKTIEADPIILTLAVILYLEEKGL
jgi:hypothetical protein